MTLAPQAADRLRRRTIWSLFGGVGVATVPFFAVATISPIVARDIAGSERWSGFAYACGVIGSGIGATVLSRIMARHGRRPGLVTGLAVATAGCILSVVGIDAESLGLFLVGLAMIGVGYAASQLSRYVAAELAHPDRRASAIGLVVWASTVGAIAGPNVVSWSGAIAAGWGLPRPSGALLTGVLGYGIAAVAMFVLLRPDPAAIAIEDLGRGPSEGLSVPAMLQASRARGALIVLVMGQAVMILVMAMTPVHLSGGGHGLGTIGVVMSAHFAGMFGVSPATGWLVDRLGHVPVISFGFALLAAAALTAASIPPDAGGLLAVPLFLVGLGWNFSFVSGSALLTHGLAYRDRARLQGATDTVVWVFAAAASLGSGFIVDASSYRTLCLISAALVLLPLTATLAGRRAMVAAT